MLEKFVIEWCQISSEASNVLPLSQCRKTVMTPLRNIQGTRNIKGYSFYENLRPNHMTCRAFCKISWKHLFLGFFLIICQTGWIILLFLDCFYTSIWPLKVIKKLFINFNHQIKSITPLNCNMKLIQFVFSRGDSALCYCYVSWTFMKLHLYAHVSLNESNGSCTNSKGFLHDFDKWTMGFY